MRGNQPQLVFYCTYPRTETDNSHSKIRGPYHDSNPPNSILILCLLMFTNTLGQVGVVGQLVEKGCHHRGAVHFFLQGERENEKRNALTKASTFWSINNISTVQRCEHVHGHFNRKMKGDIIKPSPVYHYKPFRQSQCTLGDNTTAVLPQTGPCSCPHNSFLHHHLSWWMNWSLSGCLLLVEYRGNTHML